MAARDPVIESVVEAIAEGQPVDWPALSPGGAALEAALEQLRVIQEIAQVHRGLGDLDATAPPVSTGGGTRLSGPPLDGWRWGPLIVGECLGGGAFGNVYRAWDPSLEHEVALKLQPASAVALRDGQLATKVTHTNVITVHGAAEIDGRVGIWMDLIHGRTLEQLGSVVGELSAAEAIVVGESVCGALAAVHGAGLLHRDIKASNVMRENGGRMVLIDFGVGTQVEREAQSGGGIVGTLLYMAPEVLEGARASVRSDIYSLGVLLFYLVTRSFPVYGRSREELRHAHLTGRRKLLSDVRPDLPRPFVTAVERAISPDRKDRYQTAGELLAALTATEPKAAEAKPIPLERYILVTAVGVVLFATLMGGLGTAAFNQAFQRTGFADDTPWEWLVLGFKSMLSPAIEVALILTGAVILGSLGSRAAGVIPALRALDSRSRALAAAAGGRLGLQDGNGIAFAVVLIGASALAVAWWSFGPLLVAPIVGLSATDSDVLRLFTRDYLAYHQAYRLSFVLIAAFLLGGGLTAWRTALRAKQRLRGGFVGAMAAATFLSLISLGLSYRVIFHSDFPRVTVDGERCYVTGQDDRRLLLFCPWRDGLTENRRQVVAKDDPALGRIESAPVAMFCDSIELFDAGAPTPSDCS